MLGLKWIHVSKRGPVQIIPHDNKDNKHVTNIQIAQTLCVFLMIFCDTSLFLPSPNSQQ